MRKLSFLSIEEESVRLPSVLSILAVSLLAIPACDTAGPEEGPAGLPPYSGQPFLSASPMDYVDINGIVPLGNLNPPGHVFPTDHIYFYLANGGGGTPPAMPVYSPGDLVVTQVRASEHLGAGFADFTLTLSPCEEITVVFMHLSALLEDIFGDTSSFQDWQLDNEYSTGGETYRLWSKSVEIGVDAGQQIGTVGGNPGQHALDLGVYDLRKTVSPVANPSRWTETWYLHARCPLDYYEEGAVGDQLWDLVIREEMVGDETPGGSILQDLPGTAKGCWFLEGVAETYPEDPHLALVRSNTDPNRTVISMGTSIPVAGGQAWSFLPEGEGLLNRDFAEVTSDGQIYGFELVGLPGIVILQMPDEETLWIEYIQGGTSEPGGWIFSGEKVVFVR